MESSTARAPCAPPLPLHPPPFTNRNSVQTFMACSSSAHAVLTMPQFCIRQVQPWRQHQNERARRAARRHPARTIISTHHALPRVAEPPDQKHRHDGRRHWLGAGRQRRPLRCRVSFMRVLLCRTLCSADFCTADTDMTCQCRPPPLLWTSCSRMRCVAVPSFARARVVLFMLRCCVQVPKRSGQVQHPMTVNFNFKCHRNEEKQGQQTVSNAFPCNAVAFNNKYNTMATCGSDGTYVLRPSM